MARIYNFSAGPCTLPVEVLEQARDRFVDFEGEGMSLIEMSHRSKTVVAVHEKALALVRELLAVPESHHVLFLGGGATLQFGMIPANLLRDGAHADYTHSGAWAKKAIGDAKALGKVNVIWDGADASYTALPDPSSIQSTDGAAYLHLTSNETIGGIQWKTFPKTEAPLVADMSSDIFSRPVDWSPFGIVYAGAQKNIGPAGLSLVILRKDLLARCPQDMPLYLNYHKHVDADSMLNTPPVFQIWMVSLVLELLKGKGGVAWAEQMAEARSKLLYDTIEALGDFYRCPVDAAVRSPMNVVFRLPSEDLEARFVAEAAEAGMNGLKGHRSVGGCRASIYNAMPIEGAEALRQFMMDFARKN
ncbi:MAG: 3-phosphoserine/phosphohydroxythreonine transaminase, partial [Phycisphaeraceae bacterium]|nr:3-phosphoserine/phosphohydroxythreonine transaminase [Phycisphaeraceae bacterium]